MLGESVKIDLQNAAASGTKVLSHGSRLNSVPKSPPSSVKVEYSLFHLGIWAKQAMFVEPRLARRWMLHFA